MMYGEHVATLVDARHDLCGQNKTLTRPSVCLALSTASLPPPSGALYNCEDDKKLESLWLAEKVRLTGLGATVTPVIRLAQYSSTMVLFMSPWQHCLSSGKDEGIL